MKTSFLLLSLLLCLGSFEASAGVHLEWDRVEGAVKYVIQYRREGSTVWSRFDVGEDTGVELTLPKGVFHVRIVAVEENGVDSLPSSEILVEF